MILFLPKIKFLTSLQMFSILNKEGIPQSIFFHFLLSAAFLVTDFYLCVRAFFNAMAGPFKLYPK